MLGRQELCSECGEPIDIHKDYHAFVSDLPPNVGIEGRRKVWHYQCTNLDNDEIDPHYLARFNSWFIRKLMKENAS